MDEVDVFFDERDDDGAMDSDDTDVDDDPLAFCDVDGSDDGHRDDPVPPPCDDDPAGAPGSKRMKTAMASIAPPPDYVAMFASYARPQLGESIDRLSFMLVDAEGVASKIRADMDDPTVEHFMPTDDLPSFSGAKRPRESSYADRSPFVLGPVVKLYGVCSGGSSVCVDVYGHYPSFRLQVVRGTPSIACMDRIRTHLEANVLKKPPGQSSSPTCSAFHHRGPVAREVVRATMKMAFSAFPYTERPSVFYEYGLARAQHVRALAEYFVKTPQMADDRSAGGVLGIVPHSGEDSLTQYMVASGISGFGWVSATNVEDPHDDRRIETDACACGTLGDCSRETVLPESGRDDIAPLRVLGIDIECLKDEGMPDPHRNPVIIIGAIACTAVGGMVDPESMRRLLFAWSPPGSDGISEVEGAHLVVSARDEAGMFLAFGTFVNAYDPDMFVGHNIIGFDIPYLVTRANVLGVREAMYMGRRRERTWYPPREIVRVRKNGDTRKSLRVETPGRIQLDTLPFIQNMKKESSYGLGALSQKYLGEGKDDVGYQMIAPMWRQSRETRARLCSYCLKDVQLSLGLATAKDFEMILSVIELSRGTRVRASQLLRSGNQEKVKTLVLNEAKNPRFDPQDLPVFFPYEKPKTRAKDDKFQGATVVSPKRGARGKDTPVAVGDFSSLYPSIMLAHNLCVHMVVRLRVLIPRPRRGHFTIHTITL
jgi:DNA polymerase delta subunit 1